MKSKLFITLATIAISSQSSFAALYTLNSGTGSTASGIVDLAGNAFRGGTSVGDTFTGTAGGTSAGPGVVGFGIFSTDTLSSLSATNLVNAFTVFGGTVAFNTAGTTGNRSVYTDPQGATVTGSSFAGKSVYLFAGNGTTYANSTQFLVAKATSFTFNASDDALPTPTVYTIRPDNSTVLFGTTVTNVLTASTDTSTTAGWKMAAVVPEASTALLGAIGALGLLRRRRN